MELWKCKTPLKGMYKFLSRMRKCVKSSVKSSSGQYQTTDTKIVEDHWEDPCARAFLQQCLARLCNKGTIFVCLYTRGVNWKCMADVMLELWVRWPLLVGRCPWSQIFKDRYFQQMSLNLSWSNTTLLCFNGSQWVLKSSSILANKKRLWM